MSRSNPLLWPKLRLILGLGIAILTTQWPLLRLVTAPVSLFLCAVMVTAWFGGVGPGLLATTLSSLAFDYYFLSPIYSLAAKPGEIPRLSIFTVSAPFVGSLSAAQRSATESLKRVRDDLKGTVQQLQRSNVALQVESLERKHANTCLRWLATDMPSVEEDRAAAMYPKGQVPPACVMSCRQLTARHMILFHSTHQSRGA
jgi:K+-sensing histidine kinase KdpD